MAANFSSRMSVTNWLDGKHTVFGQVRSGQEVVNAIRQGDTLKSVRIEEA